MNWPKRCTKRTTDTAVISEWTPTDAVYYSVMFIKSLYGLSSRWVSTYHNYVLSNKHKSKATAMKACEEHAERMRKVCTTSER